MSRECCGPEDVQTSAGGPIVADQDLPTWWKDRSLALPALSGLFLSAGYVAQWSSGENVGTVLHALGLAAGAWTFAPAALRHLARGFLGVGLLMTIAAIGAVALGHVAEAAALAFLFSVAEALEDRAMDKAKHGLSALLSLVPQVARVTRGDRVHDVAVADLRVDDVLMVAAGERVATDGVVVRGRSSVDTAAITGESIPVELAPGDEVLAGSVNGSGALQIRATADGTDNSLTTIVRLVREAHSLKGERARLADRVARPLVPLVLATAALVAGLGSLFGESSTWVERALVVLVAASPCALAIAVPVTVISAIGSASRLGVIIKSGEAFEQFGTIRQVALDKTGTLTRNQPQVSRIESAPDVTPDEVILAAASLERTSTHPLAGAIVAVATDIPSANDVLEEAGHGIAGTVDGRRYRVGSPRWIEPGPLSDAAGSMAADGMSIVVVERDAEVIGVIGVRDELRPEAAEAVAALIRQGITPVMLTGDNSRTARALAAEAGVETVHAEQLPQDKAAVVQAMAKQAPTAMIGDGINDAPALATATVGIAMGATGSAAAVESADIAFTGHDLRQIPVAIEHARRGRAIMTGNIALALAIIIVLFPLALFGVLGLAGVVLVHEVAEVIVILNGLRAARLRHGTVTTDLPPAAGAPVEVAGACADGCCAPVEPVLSLSPTVRTDRG